MNSNIAIMSKPNDEQVLQQTEAIWRFLDTMSLKSPKEYEQFINKVLKDGENDNLGPPTPVFVVETMKIPEVIPVRKYFINFAQWIQVPKPENETSPVGIATSDIRKEVIDKEWSHIIDVTLNPVVFPSNDSSDQLKKCALVELVFRYIESKFSLKLSRKFKFIEESTYIGNQDNLLNFMCPSAVKNKLSDTVNGANNNLTLDQIKQLSGKEVTKEQARFGLSNDKIKDEKPCSRSKKEVNIVTQENMNSAIKEIKTVSKKRTTPKLATPKVEMLVCKDKNTVELTIHLPKVESVSECDLEITETSLSLHVPNKYELELSFPVDINIDDSTAKFVKDQKILLISASPLSNNNNDTRNHPIR